MLCTNDKEYITIIDKITLFSACFTYKSGPSENVFDGPDLYHFERKIMKSVNRTYQWELLPALFCTNSVILACFRTRSGHVPHA